MQYEKVKLSGAVVFDDEDRMNRKTVRVGVEKGSSGSVIDFYPEEPSSAEKLEILMRYANAESVEDLEGKSIDIIIACGWVTAFGSREKDEWQMLRGTTQPKTAAEIAQLEKKAIQDEEDRRRRRQKGLYW